MTIEKKATEIVILLAERELDRIAGSLQNLLDMGDLEIMGPIVKPLASLVPAVERADGELQKALASHDLTLTGIPLLDDTEDPEDDFDAIQDNPV